jgi:hypothetical protein
MAGPHSPPRPSLNEPVHMITLTKEREIASYAWVHPDEDRRYPNNLDCAAVMPCNQSVNRL